MKTIKIKKILVPVDFTESSDIAILKAVTLARLLKADLFFIHVIEFNGYHFSVEPEMIKILPSQMDIEKAIVKTMTELQGKIRKKYGIKPEVFIATGHIHTEIINFSENRNIDLIVMGTHGASGYKELFIGTNAQRVVTLSKVPVLTIQKGSNKLGFKNILLPIDNSLHSREKVNLTMLIANLFGAKIHIIGLPDSKVKQELNKFRIKCESVEKIISSFKLPYKTSLVHGKNLAKAAMEYAVKSKCDLIVINTGHESKVSGIFLGAFAQQIVNHSKIPVLSFRHEEGHFIIDTPGYGIS